MSKSKKLRKTHSKEFKTEAAKMVVEQGSTQAEVARNLGITSGQIHQWVGDYKADPEHAFPGKGHLSPVDERTRQLEALSASAHNGARHIKKGNGVLLGRPEVKYAFILSQWEQYPITVMCHVLEVSRSGYFDWSKRDSETKAAKKLALVKLVEQIHLGSRRT